MAELVGLIASISGIAAMGAKASTSLYIIGSSVASAKEDMCRLGDEVTALSLVFGHLANALNAPGPFGLTAEARDSVAWIVRRCEDTFAELQKLLKGYSVAGGLGGGGVASGGLKNRVKYSFRKERIVFLRSSLDSYKTTLQLMLHVVERAPFLNGDVELSGSTLTPEMEEANEATTETLMMAQAVSIDRLKDAESMSIYASSQDTVDDSDADRTLVDEPTRTRANPNQDTVTRDSSILEAAVAVAANSMKRPSVESLRSVSSVRSIWLTGKWVEQRSTQATIREHLSAQRGQRSYDASPPVANMRVKVKDSPRCLETLTDSWFQMVKDSKDVFNKHLARKLPDGDQVAEQRLQDLDDAKAAVKSVNGIHIFLLQYKHRQDSDLSQELFGLFRLFLETNPIATQKIARLEKFLESTEATLREQSETSIKALNAQEHSQQELRRALQQQLDRCSDLDATMRMAKARELQGRRNAQKLQQSLDEKTMSLQSLENRLQQYEGHIRAMHDENSALQAQVTEESTKEKATQARLADFIAFHERERKDHLVLVQELEDLRQQVISMQLSSDIKEADLKESLQLMWAELKEEGGARRNNEMLLERERERRQAALNAVLSLLSD